MLKQVQQIKKNLCIFGILNIILIAGLGFNNPYCTEMNKIFADQDLCLETRINFSLELALKKYQNQKIWLIYSIDNFQAIRENRKKETDPLQLALILDYSLESGRPRLYHLYVQTMTQPLPEENRPFFWLGKGASAVSVDWLTDQFYRTDYEKLKQQIIKAVGIHSCSNKVIEFQKKIIAGCYPVSLKSEAISCLSQHHSAETTRLLTYLAFKQKDIRLRKKAIFALSQMNNKKAQWAVIALATKDKNNEIRQEAIFWLSQNDNSDAIKIFNHIMTNETDPRIKESTIFAISQLPAKKATPILTHIARSHPDSSIRDRALFWLTRTKEKRMMDFWDELLDGNNEPIVN